MTGKQGCVWLVICNHAGPGHASNKESLSVSAALKWPKTAWSSSHRKHNVVTGEVARQQITP